MLGTEKALDDLHWVTLSDGRCQLFCCHRKGHFLGGNTNLSQLLGTWGVYFNELVTSTFHGNIYKF